MQALVLPINHLLLENNRKAREFRKSDASELLVIFSREGEILDILPPDRFMIDGYEFRDPEPLLELIRKARACGIQEATPGDEKAPEGWILWQDLEPGTMAYDGHNQHILRFSSPFAETVDDYQGFGKPRKTKEIQVDTVWLANGRTMESVRAFADVKDPRDVYLKVQRTGLTTAQCLEIRKLCKAGDYAVFSPTYIL